MKPIRLWGDVERCRARIASVRGHLVVHAALRCVHRRIAFQIAFIRAIDAGNNGSVVVFRHKSTIVPLTGTRCALVCTIETPLVNQQGRVLSRKNLSLKMIDL